MNKNYYLWQTERTNIIENRMCVDVNIPFRGGLSALILALKHDPIDTKTSKTLHFGHRLQLLKIE
jgi:hypothetical protein